MGIRKKPDAQLKTEVNKALKRDKRVMGTDVGVEVHAGIVTLTGTVDSRAALSAAEEAAHRVAGVLDVANDIHFKVPDSAERNDTDIAQAVRCALESNVLVPHERIRTTVSDGVVTLDGHVAQWSQHDDAVRCLGNLAGVRAIRNFIRVEPPPRRTTITELRRAIDLAMSRHAEHAAKHVQISMVNGDVTLRGQVPSWADRSAIEGAVRGTTGVQKVDNQLRVLA